MILLIEERMRVDPIARFLFERSSITMIQLDTYMIELLGRKDDLGLNDKIKLRDGRYVTKGAFMRTLKQARKQFEGAICTVILAEYFGLLHKGTLSRVMEVGDLIASNVSEPSNQT